MWKIEGEALPLRVKINDLGGIEYHDDSPGDSQSWVGYDYHGAGVGEQWNPPTHGTRGGSWESQGYEVSIDAARRGLTAEVRVEQAAAVKGPTC